MCCAYCRPLRPHPQSPPNRICPSIPFIAFHYVFHIYLKCFRVCVCVFDALTRIQTDRLLAHVVFRHFALHRDLLG